MRKDNDIYIREQQINKALNNFVHCSKIIDTKSESDYNMMYKKKTYIKKMLIIQQSKAFLMNYRRYQFLEEQLMRFKKEYTRWKKRTFYIFLMCKMNVPSYLIDNFYGGKNDRYFKI